ncbi:MAG: hypothetical protein HON14_04400 [Rhodospirillaceae bacterium]|jgi:hypothetical protein|nr:hypothetical protein [Rhodospirillaceae bacterium]MBT4589142.1 hypothetical protein [Rhodospirillaceae bacterium]MBT4938350.1 hypothetical protein [Rhodospirillaceae bacterium]MBT5941362.1 hypothetical protein [Rhodospirillaceae bacterium]MBT7268519.1 hypothetical protein [Rhodospirillaceae bacterium]
MKIEEKITKLLSVTTRLSKILKQENELLAASARANGIKPLQEQKIALSNAYEQQFKIIRDDEDLAKIDPSLAHRLQEAVISFGLLLEENVTRIKAKMDAIEHLFRIISESAKAHQGQTAGYGNSGAKVNNARQAYPVLNWQLLAQSQSHVPNGRIVAPNLPPRPIVHRERGVFHQPGIGEIG